MSTHFPILRIMRTDFNVVLTVEKESVFLHFLSFQEMISIDASAWIVCQMRLNEANLLDNGSIFF